MTCKFKFILSVPRSATETLHRGRRSVATTPFPPIAAFMSKTTFFQSAVLALAFSLTSFQVIANPIDPNPQVIAGQVEFEGLNSEAASILQQSQQAIVDYAMFNVPDGSSVQFIQPNSDATILNRITGADPSFIKGSIIANGQVFMVNPAGVAFGPDSVIRADMFMAIAGDLSNSSFLQGDLDFSLTGSVENQGSLSAQRGVALLGRQVKNTGQIVAEDGFVLLASGDEVLLQPNGTNLAVQLDETTEAVKQAGIGVENLGEVDGEEIMFSAGDAFATAVRHNGVARATQSIELHSDGGRIEVGGELVAGTEDGGRIEVGGTDLGGEGTPTAASVTISESAVVDASSQGEGDGGHVVVWSDGLTEMFGGIVAVGGPSGSGGYAEVSGREVDFGYAGWNIALGAGGEFLLDPVDVVIDAATAGNIVQSLSGGTAVSIVTSGAGADNGNITVDSPIEVASVQTPATLSLISDGDIVVNASLESGQVFPDGSTAFSLEAGGNITINENIRTGISGAESQGAVLLTAGGDINLNASIDSSNGPLAIRAINDISLASGNQLLTGGSGSEAGLLMEIVSDIGAVTFNGGVIQLFGDTDVYIEADQFLNYSGSNLIGGPGTGSWNIHLPHPLGRTSVAAEGDRHQYGSLNSLNQAFYGASNGAPEDVTQNHYLFANQPTIEIQAHDAEKTYGNDGQPLLGGGGFTAVSADLVDASAFGSVFTQDTLQTVLSGDVSLSSDASATTAGVGNYDIRIEGFAFPNGYVPNYVIGQFTVNPRAVTLVANTQERIYGNTMPLDGTAFTVRDLGVEGDSFLPNSETIVEVVLSSANGGGTNTNLDAGTYASDLSISQDTSSLQGSGTFSAANYSFTYLPGDLVINRRPISIQANQQTKYYGDIDELETDSTAFTIIDLDSNADLPNNDDILSVDLSSLTDRDVSQVSDVDTYTNELRISGVTGNDAFNPDNYILEYLDGDYQIQARPITLTAADRSRLYGDTLELGETDFILTDQGLTATEAAFELPNGETIDRVTLTSTDGRAGSTIAAAGTYDDNIIIEVGSEIGSNGFRSSNYAITLENGEFVIEPRPVTLTATGQARVYGDDMVLSDTAFTVTDVDLDSDLPNGELIDTVNLNSANGVDVTTTASAGSYTDEIQITGQDGSAGFDASNYELTYVDGDLVVNRRAVTLTALQQDRIYGDPMVLDDTAFAVLDLDDDSELPNGEVIDTVSLESAAGVDSDTTAGAGFYSGNLQITGQAGSGGFDAANYDLSYVNGDLVVSQRAVTLTALQQDRIYGNELVLDDTAFTVLDLDSDNSLPNGEVIDTVALNSVNGVDITTTSNVGTYTDEIQIVGQTGEAGTNFNAANYDLTYVAGDLVINQRAVTLTASQQERIYGNELVLDDTAFTVEDLDGGPALPNGEVIDTVALNSVTGADLTTTANAGLYEDEIEITGQNGSAGFEASNYDLTYVAGDLQVNQRAVTLTALQQERIYGDELVLDETAFTVTDLDGDNALPNEEVIDTVDLASVWAIPGTLGGVDQNTAAPVGVYADNILILDQNGSNGFDARNYDLSYVSADLVVNQRAVTLTASQQERIYGNELLLDDVAFTIRDLDGDSILPNGEVIDTVALNSVTGVDVTTTANVGRYVDQIEITNQSGSNGFDAANYDLSYVDGDLVVNQRAVTLTASQQERIYGDELLLDDTAFTLLDLDGDTVLPNGEVIDTVALTSANGVDTMTTASVGRYGDEIVITDQTGSGGFAPGNYDLSYVDGDLVVNQRAVTLTASQQERIYGDSMALDNTAFTLLDLDGDSVLPNGEVIDTVALNSVTGVDVTTTSNVGTYADEIEITGQAGSNGFSAGNYDLSYVTGDLVVNQRAVTLTASQQERIYGDSMVLDETAFTVTDLDGDSVLPNGEAVETVALNSVNAIDTTTTANVGGYGDEIEITGQSGSNGFDAGNYDLTYVAGDLVVNQRAVTLTASQQERIYGDTMVLDETAFTVTDLDGDSVLPNGEVVDTVALNSVTGVDVTTTSNVGTYADEIEITGQAGSNGFSAGNYDLSYVNGDLVVNQRAVTLTASQQERIYGNAMVLDDTAFTVTDLDGDSALPNGESIDTVALNSVAGVDVTTASNVGTYADEIEITGQAGSNGFSAGNYDLSYVTGDLVVNQRAVTLTASQQERIYGDAMVLDNTAFTVTDLDGDSVLPNGEVIDTVALNSVTGIDATTTANVGGYGDEIEITGQSGSNGFDAGNYDLSYVTGDLVVNQRAVTLTASQQERIYGDTIVLDDTAFTVTDLDGDSVLPNGEVVDTVVLNSVTGVDVTTASNVGTYADEIEITGQAGSNGFSAGNYDLSYETGDLVVNQRAVTLTASQQERIYGDAMVLDDTAFTVTDLDGDAVLPNGEVIDTVALNTATGVDVVTTSNVGTYADEIAITGQAGSNGFSAGNYDLTYVTGDLVVNQRAVTLTALQQERIYGNAMVLDDTAFRVTDLDGDAVLPNGEVVDTVVLNSVTGVDVTTTSNVGTYLDEIAITGQAGSNGFDAGNYDLSYVEGDLVVNQRAVTLTASQQERIYGDTMVLDTTAFTVTDLDGDSVLPNGEVVDTVALNSVTGVDVTTSSNVGTYVDEIEITGQAGSNGFSADNYDLSYVTGDLVVNQRAVTLTASQQERIYGDAMVLDDTSFTVSDLDGDSVLPNGEVVDTVALDSVTGVDVTTTSNVGTYADEIAITDQAGSNGFDAGNYDLTYVTGDLVVNQRSVTLTALQQERGYGTSLTFDSEAFTVLDMDGDNALPNGELIETVDLVSEGGVAQDLIAFPVRYPENLRIVDQSGSDGFLAENYDFTYVPGDLVVKGFPQGTVLFAEGSLEAYFDLLRGVSKIEAPFGLVDSPSRVATMLLYGYPEWEKLSAASRKWVLAMIDLTPDEKLTEQYLLFLVRQAVNEG